LKFSVLLPTRNRLELLRFAVETVRRQDYDDWEIIISDNDSEQDIKEFSDSLGDPRIKYFRTKRFLPVTENWNHALEKCSGDYVVMLGDDDGLLQGYFKTAKQLIEKFSTPDFIYTSAYLFAYPGVFPDSPDGFLRDYGYASFFRGGKEAHWLDKNSAIKLVERSMNFKVCFGYNMQYFIINKRFINSLMSAGPFFQSPYPDYYAANVLFLKAEKILVFPKPSVTIGISPKSFGFFYFNDQDKIVTDFLNSFPEQNILKQLREILLPGTDMNTSWLIAMETIKNNFVPAGKIKLNYSRYRFLQTVHTYRNNYNKKTPGTKKQLTELKNQLSIKEKLLFLMPLSAYYNVIRLMPNLSSNILIKHLVNRIASHPPGNLKKVDVQCSNVLEVFKKISPITYSLPDKGSPPATKP